MQPSSVDIRKAIENKWNAQLARYGRLYSSSSLSGSSPPSVFVGSYGYPKVGVGPMAPPSHGDTSLLDSPERWAGMGLDDIVNFRLRLVRGVRNMRADETSGRYVTGLQEMAMASGPADSELQFERAALPSALLDGYSAPFGSVGLVRRARFDSAPADARIEKAYYDGDLGAAEAIVNLYEAGLEVSRIQKCLSVGMLGRTRKLVPTKWSITATDDVISRTLVRGLLDAPVIDENLVFSFSHIGNLYSVILFPHRWVFEMTEAWYSDGSLGFGSDGEDWRGMRRAPLIAGAYYAAKLAVSEYLARRGVQAGVLILREIRPEYAIPVGVWQVREGIRQAMAQRPLETAGFAESLDVACRTLSIPKERWLARGRIKDMLRQKEISEYF